jgi:NAD(P)-dependent dehydrogenase (short-subunit alcohol dehydrogenase family)
VAPTSPQLALSGTVALITGAGRGIGRAVAERFARAGACLVLCARTRRELMTTVAGIRSSGGEVIYRVADISSVADARGVVQLALRHYGRLDLVVNNAGILGPRISIADYPLREWNRVLRINLTGTFHVSREAARVMIKQRRGCLVMISSSVGHRGRGGWGAYAVSKFAVEGLAQVMAEELRPFGVSVLSFNPGGTRTTMRAAAYPDEDPLTVRNPSIPAEALLQLLTRPTLELSGQSFDLAGLLSEPVTPAVSLTTRKSK